MPRRFLLSLLLVVTGFAAGMVLTARARIATESVAETLASPQAAGQAAPRPATPAVPLLFGAARPPPSGGSSGQPGAAASGRVVV